MFAKLLPNCAILLSVLPLCLTTMYIPPSEMELDCNALPLPLHAFYDRGHCYVFDLAIGQATWEESVAGCKHIGGAHHSGLALWIPITVRDKAAAVIPADSVGPYMKFGVSTPTASNDSHAVDRAQFIDEFMFGQSLTFDAPRWQSNLVTNALMPTAFDYDNSLGTLFSKDTRYCLTYNANSGKVGRNTCTNTRSWNIGFVCQYENKFRHVTKLSSGQRLPLGHAVEQHTVTSHLMSCAVAHSAAYATLTGDCQLYVADNRLETWSAVVEVDADYDLWQYGDT